MARVNVLQFSKFVLFISCFSILMFEVYQEFKRYMNNYDSSSITFRKFNYSPNDKYPDITLCLVEFKSKKPILEESYLQKYNVSVSHYWNIITGKINATFYDIENLPDFSNVTINLDQWIISVKSSYISNDITMPGKIFYLSHQDSSQICYSMPSEYKPDKLKFMEEIILDTTKVSGGILRVYLNFEGQNVRSFGKEIFRRKLRLIANKLIHFRLSAFTVLRRRLNGKEPCNPNYEEDDDGFRSYVMDKVKCIPPYWKIFYPKYLNLKSCITNVQLKEASNYCEYRKHYDVLDHLKPPCSEMTAVSSAEKVKWKASGTELKLRFYYRDVRYLEIRNLRDFTFNSFWSSIGGFVGMFLGFSMFQVMENMLRNVYELINRTKTNELNVIN